MSNLVAPPYGRDLSATDAIDATRIVSGGRLLAEAAYRRLITRKGSLRYAKNYGFRIADLMNEALDAARIEAIPRLVDAELRQDDRLASVTVVASVDRSAAPSISMTLDITGLGRDGSEFTLVVRASEVDVQLLNVRSNDG